jgi:hypothetical protein
MAGESVGVNVTSSQITDLGAGDGSNLNETKITRSGTPERQAGR